MPGASRAKTQVMVQARRHVPRVYELGDLGSDDALETPDVGTEVPLAVRVGKQSDRRHAIGRGEHVATEYAVGFTADGYPLMFVAHCHLVTTVHA